MRCFGRFKRRSAVGTGGSYPSWSESRRIYFKTFYAYCSKIFSGIIKSEQAEISST